MGRLRKHVIWAAVFDGGRARLFRCQDAALGQARLVALDTRELDNPPAHEHGRDRPGRAPIPSGGRAAFDAGDPREKAQTRFVRDFAEHVEAQAKIGAFDRLVLIAPAQWLTCFHDAAHEAVKLILAEDAADVTKAPLKDLEQRIERLIKPML